MRYLRRMRTASKLILEARQARGLSQAAFARRAGVSRSTLNAYERGKRQPGADTLARILRAAGFEIRAVPLIDYERNARVLTEALDLAGRLPWRPRKSLSYPSLRHMAD